MRDEFMFRLGAEIKLLNLEEMAEVFSSKVINDFREMDRAIVEIYDIRQQQKDPKNKQSSIGRMSLSMALQKFR